MTPKAPVQEKEVQALLERARQYVSDETSTYGGYRTGSGSLVNDLVLALESNAAGQAERQGGKERGDEYTKAADLRPSHENAPAAAAPAVEAPAETPMTDWIIRETLNYPSDACVSLSAAMEDHARRLELTLRQAIGALELCKQGISYDSEEDAEAGTYGLPIEAVQKMEYALAAYRKLTEESTEDRIVKEALGARCEECDSVFDCFNGRIPCIRLVTKEAATPLERLARERDEAERNAAQVDSSGPRLTEDAAPAAAGPDVREAYNQCFRAAFEALQKLNSVRFIWNAPIHQAVALLRSVTEPQSSPLPPARTLSDEEIREIAREAFLRSDDNDFIVWAIRTALDRLKP